MELSKRSKITLGIATILEVAFPLLLVLLYMLTFFLLPILMAFNPQSESAVFVFFFIGMMFFFFIMIFFSIFQIAMKILYIIMAVNNKQSTDSIRILFVLGIFYIPYIAMPLYYLIYYLKEKKEGEGMENVED